MLDAILIHEFLFSKSNQNSAFNLRSSTGINSSKHFTPQGSGTWRGVEGLGRTTGAPMTVNATAPAGAFKHKSCPYFFREYPFLRPCIKAYRSYRWRSHRRCCTPLDHCPCDMARAAKAVERSSASIPIGNSSRRIPSRWAVYPCNML